jgi:predicted RNase H-like HicB family nuclease
MPVAKTRILPEKIRKPLAFSLHFKLLFHSDKGPVAMGWYAEGMPVLLYYTEDNECVAKCLPFNQVGMGDSVASALESLVEALTIILEDAVENKYLEQLIEDVNSGVGRPRDFYWQKYAEAVKAQSELKRKIRLPRKITTDRVTVTPQYPIDLRALRNMRRQFVSV